MADLTPSQLHILLHTLGLEDPTRVDSSRNHYVTGDPIEADILALVAAGLMEERPRPGFLADDDRVFVATLAGIRMAKSQRPKPPKLTRSQERFERFRRWSDVTPDGTFRDFLRWEGGRRG